MSRNNQYRVLKNRQQKEVDDFPMFCAFNAEQFDKGMKSFDLEPRDTKQICKIGNTGCFCRRSDAPRLHELLGRHEAEIQAAVDADATGKGFIFEMFNEELANHEYSYTGDIADALNALDLTPSDILRDKRLKRGLKLAMANQ